MWITNLPKYMFECASKPHLLHNSSVVIDGISFMYEMYEESKLPFVFGCEADAFARYLKKRLGIFREANIQCYVVFKGGDSKLLHRKLMKTASINDGEKFDFKHNNMFVPPLFMKNVYMQVLDELGIPYAVCEFETARECVALACKLNCPVISFNPDLYFLKAPFISAYKFNRLELKNGTKTIECKKYFKLEDFLRKHSLTEQKLAIFAVLTDQNTFPEGFFHKLLKSLNLFNTAFITMYQMIWQWLARRDVNAALNIILESLSPEVKDKFFLEMYKIMDFMKTKQQSFVVDYLLSGGKLYIRANDPMWFLKGVVSKKIATRYINLYNTNNWITTNAIESNNSKHSLLLSMDIIKYAYQLLTGYKRKEFKLVINAKVTQISVDNSGETPTDVFANGWDDIQKLELFQRFLRQNSIDVGLIAQIPSEAAILIIALVYFARKKSCENVTVTKEVYSIIVCYVMLANPASKKAANLYFKVHEDEMMRIFDRNLIHNLVEFQHCLEQMNYLNILCGAPYTPTVYHRTYNGTFVYKLYRELSTDSDDPITFLNKAISISTSVLNEVKSLFTFYEMLS